MYINDRYEFLNYVSLNLKCFDNVSDRFVMISRICHRFQIFEKICIMIFRLLKNMCSELLFILQRVKYCFNCIL